MICARTRDALARPKARGKVLGSPELERAREKAAEVVNTEADRRASNVLPIIEARQVLRRYVRSQRLRECELQCDSAGRAVAHSGREECADEGVMVDRYASARINVVGLIWPQGVRLVYTMYE